MDGSVRILSAGTSTPGGQPASRHAAFVVADRGGSLAGHVSTPVHDAQLQDADIVLTMTQAQRDTILRRWPMVSPRVQTLGEAAGEPMAEIPDPFGGTLADYESAYQEIERLILGLEPTLRARILARSGAADEAGNPESGPEHPEKGRLLQ